MPSLPLWAWLVVAFLAAGPVWFVCHWVRRGLRHVIWFARWCGTRGVRHDRLGQAHHIEWRWRRTATELGFYQTRERRKGHNGETKTETITPRIGAWPQPWGVRVQVTTLPKVGLTEYDKAADWLADTWGADTVEVERVRPGRIELRAVYGDPLAQHRPYGWPDAARFDWRLPIGHNPWGEPVSIPVKNLSGVKIGGMPGYGKSALLSAWTAVLAAQPSVQVAIFDGKTRNATLGDWGVFADRAMFLAGDDPEAAGDRLAELVELVKARPEALRAERGTHKFWSDGPTETNPLVVVVVDEAHNYVDDAGVTDRDEKKLIGANQRALRTLVKEGRSLGVLVLLATQKGTADALPTAIRDNLETGVCFAVATLEAAETILGAGVRADAPNHPTLLRDKTKHVGVCVVTGVPGLDGKYSRVRVGDIDDLDVDTVAVTTANYRCDLADLIPADPGLEAAA